MIPVPAVFATVATLVSHWFEYPHIDPVAIHLFGSFGIRWYGLSYVIGALLVYLQLQSRRSRARTGISVEQAQEFVVYAMLGVIIGGRIFFLIADLLTPLPAGGHTINYYLSNPVEIIAIWHGGMAFHGGLIGAIAGIVLFARRARTPILPLLDETSLWIPLAIALTRIANFINAELPGRVTDSPLGMQFPNMTDYRYPSVLFEAAGMLVLVLPVLWLMHARGDRWRPGSIFWAFIAGYGLVRTVVEFYREPGIVFLGLTGAQYLTIAMLVLGIVMIVRSQRQGVAAAAFILACLTSAGALFGCSSFTGVRHTLTCGDKIDARAYQSAVDECTAALAANPNDSVAYNDRCLASYELGRLPDALKDCNAAVRLDPSFAMAYSNRCLVLDKQGDFAGAVSDCAKAVKLDTALGGAHSNLCLARNDAGDYAGAIDECTAALKIKPNDAKALNNRCLARENLGAYRAALADCTSAIAIDGSLAMAYSNRCLVRRDLKDLKGAIQDCTRAIVFDPNESIALNNRCLARNDAGDYQGAIADCTQAIKIAPREAIAYSNRCLALGNLKQYSQAVADCTQAVTVDPKEAFGYYNRGFFRAQLNQRDAAIADFKKAAALFQARHDRTDYQDAQSRIKELSI
ncbi:MAG TPA: prolipoprotein diacylglyceryl transferase [Candidatus Tumulicola sp.]|nr:prolipoprotein diacylglyceryl transferase [Candidatus Tumulicola sp.]